MQSHAHTLSREPRDFLAGFRGPGGRHLYLITNTKWHWRHPTLRINNGQQERADTWHTEPWRKGEPVCVRWEGGWAAVCVSVCVYIHLNEPSFHDCSTEQINSLIVFYSGTIQELWYVQYTASHFRCAQLQFYLITSVNKVNKRSEAWGKKWSLPDGWYK